MTEHVHDFPAPDAPADGTCAEILPAFAPVPRARRKQLGWKPEVQLAFIQALAETGSVREACRRVNRSDHGAYMLRRHPEAAEFRRAWDAALDIALRRIEDVAMDRAMNGVEQPVYSYGKIVGTRRAYNDRLLMFMLRNRAPDRFTGGRPKALSALDQATLKTLKAQWRAEWERERAIAQPAQDRKVGDDFIETLEHRHLRWWANLSPRARTAYRTFRRIEKEDGATGWGDDEAADIVEDYNATFAEDPRAPIDRYIESEAIGDDKLPDDADHEEEEDDAREWDEAIYGPEPEARGPRIISLKDDWR